MEGGSPRAALAVPTQSLLLFLGREPSSIDLSFRNAVNWYKPSCLSKLSFLTNLKKKKIAETTV